MKTLVINGRSYKKASEVAKELGYTADYVGQLCRSNKVEAEQVGRSWFVAEDSIKNHKADRYRSSKSKTHEDLKNRIQDTQSTTVADIKATPLRTTANFYSKTNIEYSYKEDQTELIPILKPKVTTGASKVSVKHPDQETVKIKASGDSYTLSPTALPKLRFKGVVTVSDTELPTVKKSDDDHVSETAIQTPKKNSQRHKNVVAINRDIPTANTSQALAITTKSPQTASSGRGSIGILAAGTVGFFILASLVGVFIVGLELSIVYEQANGSQVTEYHFNPANLQAVIKRL